MSVIRRGESGDLPAVAAIQSQCPESAHWNVGDYLNLDFWVALLDTHLAGFLVSRTVAADESELLNLAVSPEFRRRDVARSLIRALLDSRKGTVYLEVRESNLAARNLYKSVGFQEVNLRKDYYDSPSESAIVMKFHSC